MKLDLITKKQDEYYTPEYAIEPILKYIPFNTKIWCPFDTAKSLFVKMFRAIDCEVIHTHISKGQDFFKINVDCDYIISNPPYSLKNEVFKRLFELKKPFAMLVGVVGLFESKHRFNLFKNNDFEILYMDKRVSYFKDYSDKKPELNPPFSSVYLTHKILTDRIIFEKIFK